MLGFALVEKFLGYQGMVFVVEHKVELKIDPILIAHYFIACEYELLAQAAGAIPIDLHAKVTEVGISDDLAEQGIRALRHFGSTDAGEYLTDLIRRKFTF